MKQEAPAESESMSPPYSPEFNPIENLWSKLKTILRRIGARTYQDLDEAIATAYAQISLDNII